MHPVKPAGAAGFTLIEATVALVIGGILLAVGLPRMTSWMTASKAVAATEFYAEGLRMARAEALKRNAVARLSLNDNTSNGQQDWQVDLCVPSASVPCRDDSGVWSTPDTPLTAAAGADFKSVVRSAGNLPPSSQMTLTLSPAGATDVYFTPLGWVDGTIAPSLNRITIAPSAAKAGAFPRAALVVTLAGVVTKCAPDAVAHDSRGCPPP